MQAFQCDRCNGYYTANKEVNPPRSSDSDNFVSGIKVRTTKSDRVSSTATSMNYDLCDKCAAELLKWLMFKE